VLIEANKPLNLSIGGHSIGRKFMKRLIPVVCQGIISTGTEIPFSDKLAVIIPG